METTLQPSWVTDVVLCDQEVPATAAAADDLCVAVATELDEEECEVEEFVPVEIPPPMDEIQTHTLPSQQHSVSW